MKSLITLLSITLTAALGCSNQQSVAPTAPGPNRVEQEQLSACPTTALTGSYADANGDIKILKTSLDKNNNLVLQDGHNTFWILNGLPQYQTGNRQGSYTAYCSSQTLPGTNVTAQSDGDAAQSTTIVIVEALRNGKPYQDIQYIPAAQLPSANNSNALGFVYYVSQPGDDSRIIQNDPYFRGGH
jgi:hypothetical protein